MNNTDNPGTNSWEKIQSGVRDTERLIGQKKYNMAMIKARQTLEFMVKCLCEKSGVMEGNLIDMIDGLYDDGIISKTTCEHYHKIRTIGNKAIHEERQQRLQCQSGPSLLTLTGGLHICQRLQRDGGVNLHRLHQRGAGRMNRRAGAPPQGEVPAEGAEYSLPGPSFDAGSIIKPLLLIAAIIVVLIFIIEMIRPGKEKVPETDCTGRLNRND